MRVIIIVIAIILATTGLIAGEKQNPVVVMSTNMGNIEIELFESEAPLTVANFMSYIKDGFYNDTVFHRVINNFMIQGGGFTTDGKRKETKAPITNEAKNGLSNKLGTLAMARTNNPHSATSQFFINVKDNDFLDNNERSAGYCVFGKVIAGMEIVEKIKTTPTAVKNGMKDWPIKDVIIKSFTVK